MRQGDKTTIWNLIGKKLAGEASPDETRELERLLKNNPELHYPMQTINDLWKSLPVPDREEAENAFSRHLGRMKELDFDFPAMNAADPEDYPWPEKSRGSRLRFPALTFLGIAFLAIAVWIYRGPQHPFPAPVEHPPVAVVNEINTAEGSRTHLTLPDGTRVWLNAGSRLSYGKSYNAATREVNLTGEAFFDVARNTQKPFLIHAARIDIQVLGTSFNIKSYPTDRTTEATLIRGSIEVSIKDRPSERIILKPNEKLVVANDDSTLHRFNPRKYPTATPDEPLVAIRKPTYEQKTGTIIETSWVDNKLIFREETFGDLARQMERWYGVKIQFDDPAPEDLQFTGSFKEESIRQALDALRYTARFDYHIEGNQITINK
jgi:ferric-dicitrate binding protein FerR (iron transport regulator)